MTIRSSYSAIMREGLGWMMGGIGMVFALGLLRVDSRLRTLGLVALIVVAARTLSALALYRALGLRQAHTSQDLVTLERLSGEVIEIRRTAIRSCIPQHPLGVEMLRVGTPALTLWFVVEGFSGMDRHRLRTALRPTTEAAPESSEPPH